MRKKRTSYYTRPVVKLDDNGIVEEYQSLTEAARSNFITPHGLWHRIKTGYKCYGVRFQYKRADSREAR